MNWLDSLWAETGEKCPQEIVDAFKAEELDSTNWRRITEEELNNFFENYKIKLGHRTLLRKKYKEGKGASGAPEGINLQYDANAEMTGEMFGTSMASRGISPAALEALQNMSKDWKWSIEELIEQTAHQGVDVLLSCVSINGTAVSEYFAADKFGDFGETLKEMVAVAPDVPALLQDVIGIVCLIAVVQKDFVCWLGARGAEEAWMKLINSSNSLRESAKQLLPQHERAMKALMKAICCLLPKRYTFIIKVCALVIAGIWHRDSIARWIVANWDSIAWWGKVAAVLAVVALGLSFLGMRMKRTEDKEKR